MSMKEAYEQKLQGKLNEWSAEIDKLKAKADRINSPSFSLPYVNLLSVCTNEAAILQ